MSSDFVQSNKVLTEVGYIGLSLIVTLNVITLTQVNFMNIIIFIIIIIITNITRIIIIIIIIIIILVIEVYMYNKIDTV